MTVTDVPRVMRALSDPTRMAIFERIAREGESSVAELTRTAGISQPAVSQHLRALLDAGLVLARRQGRNTFYAPSGEGLKRLASWLQRYERFWAERFDRLDDYLHELQQKDRPQ